MPQRGLPSPRGGAVAGSAHLFRLGVIGVAGGGLSALFGVGGGVVIVPLLVALYGMDQHRAAANSLAAILCASAAGALTYFLHGEVEFWPGVAIGLPAMIGVLAGVGVQRKMPARALKFCFALLLALVGTRLLV